MALFALWIGFGSCVVSGSVWDCLGLDSDQEFARDVAGITELVGHFPMLFFEKLSLAGKAFSQTRCLPSAHCWGCNGTEVCGYLPSPWCRITLEWDRSLLGLPEHCQVVASLWMGCCQGCTEGGVSAGECRGGVCC